MRKFAACLAFALLCGLAEGRTAKKASKSSITYCAYDGTSAFIPYTGERVAITSVGDDRFEAAFDTDTERTPTFWLERRGERIFSFTADDLESGSIWVAAPRGPNSDRFALTYSDGGATGGWHVRVFQIHGGGAIEDSGIVKKAMADFTSRHRCTSTDLSANTYALKWIKEDLLIMAEVDPHPAFCGSEAGRIDGYRVSVPDGTIKEHLTLAQLKRYPGVCLQNEPAK
jgi:hypothetical protein